MKYRPEWKRKLRVTQSGDVTWCDKLIGHVFTRFSEGAKSPGGMVTNSVFVTQDDLDFASLDLALAYLVRRYAQAP